MQDQKRIKGSNGWIVFCDDLRMSFYVEYVLRYGLLLSKNVNFYLWKVKNIIIFGGQEENEQIKQKGGIL